MRINIYVFKLRKLDEQILVTWNMVVAFIGYRNYLGRVSLRWTREEL